MLFISHPREVKAAARSALEQATYNPKKLALIYAGVSSGAALLITIINYIISLNINSFGGLSGMGMRSILSTVHLVLPILIALFVPFWEMGMLRAGIGFMRNEQVSPATLTAGFRRFGPVLRLLLLRSVLLCLIGTAAAYISAILFSSTYWALPILRIIESSPTGELTEEMLMQMQPHLLPFYGLFLAVFCLVAIPFFYRLRMADFVIMDKPAGAMTAMLFSRQFMRGNCVKLFKVDLSFWWYYLASFLAAAISFLPDYLILADVTLPMSDTVVFFLCYGTYTAIQFLLSWRCASYLNTTYAMVFDAIAPKAPQNEKPFPSGEGDSDG